MVNPLDKGTMKHQFLNGLPQEVVEAMLKSCLINIQLATPNEIIEAIQQMKATLHYINMHKHQDSQRSSSGPLRLLSSKPAIVPVQGMYKSRLSLKKPSTTANHMEEHS
jgi:hypothetical protein